MYPNEPSEDFESNIVDYENVGNESINIVIDHAEDIDEEDQDRNKTNERQSPMSRLSRIDLLEGKRNALSMISFVNREFDQTWTGLIVWVFIVIILILLCVFIPYLL